MRKSPRAPIVAKYSNSVKTRVVAKFLALLNVAIRKMLSWAPKCRSNFARGPNLTYSAICEKNIWGSEKRDIPYFQAPQYIF